MLESEAERDGRRRPAEPGRVLPAARPAPARRRCSGRDRHQEPALLRRGDRCASSVARLLPQSRWVSSLAASGISASVAPPSADGSCGIGNAWCRRASLASQRIYFVMPDRYANGDPANDRGGLAGCARRHRLRPDRHRLLPRRRPEGADRRALQRIRDLGFTALWITPVLKQQTVNAGSAGYHGYWGLDFTTVDPHLGTDQDFAHARRPRARARAEGLPRRRRQPHRRRDHALERQHVLGHPVPRLPRQVLQGRRAT